MLIPSLGATPLAEAALPGRAHAFTTVAVDEHGTIIARSAHETTLYEQDLRDGISLELVPIPAGTFMMGAGAGEGYDDERPQHRVTVSAFYLGRFTVTQEQWAVVMGRALPYRCRGARLPADRVSWTDATAFCA